MNRLSIFLPTDWLQKIDSECGNNMTRSEFVRVAILRALSAKAAKSLSEIKPVGRPTKTTTKGN